MLLPLQSSQKLFFEHSCLDWAGGRARFLLARFARCRFFVFMFVFFHVCCCCSCQFLFSFTKVLVLYWTGCPSMGMSVCPPVCRYFFCASVGMFVCPSCALVVVVLLFVLCVSVADDWRCFWFRRFGRSPPCRERRAAACDNISLLSLLVRPRP